MDERDRRFWIGEAARAQAMRQLMAMEAADHPHMTQQARRETVQRYTSILAGKSAELSQEEQWERNRTSLRRKLGRRGNRR